MLLFPMFKLLSELCDIRLLVVLFFSFIVSSYLCYFLVYSFPINERIRDVLTHKKNSKFKTGGGLAFILSFLLGVSIFFGQYFFAFFILLSSFFIFIYSEFFINNIYFLLILQSIGLGIFLNDEFFLILLMVFFSLIFGFLDDMKKITRGDGFSEKLLIRWQVATGVFLPLHNYINNLSFINFFIFKVNMSVLYIPIAVFIYVATTNSVNITDGINGGLGFSTLIILGFFLLYFTKIIKGYSPFINILLSIDNFIFILFMIVSIIPFLFFNCYRNLVMGNAGSLALGSFICLLCFVMKIELLIPLVGALFLIETLSVILQVYSIRKYGKKILLFSPIHHHFELLGWSCKKIVFLMSFITFIGCLIAYFLV